MNILIKKEKKYARKTKNLEQIAYDILCFVGLFGQDTIEQDVKNEISEENIKAFLLGKKSHLFEK